MLGTLLNRRWALILGLLCFGPSLAIHSKAADDGFCSAYKKLEQGCLNRFHAMADMKELHKLCNEVKQYSYHVEESLRAADEAMAQATNNSEQRVRGMVNADTGAQCAVKKFVGESKNNVEIVSKDLQTKFEELQRAREALFKNVDEREKALRTRINQQYSGLLQGKIRNEASQCFEKNFRTVRNDHKILDEKRITPITHYVGIKNTKLHEATLNLSRIDRQASLTLKSVGLKKCGLKDDAKELAEEEKRIKEAQKRNAGKRRESLAEMDARERSRNLSTAERNTGVDRTTAAAKANKAENERKSAASTIEKEFGFIGDVSNGTVQQEMDASSLRRDQGDQNLVGRMDAAVQAHGTPGLEGMCADGSYSCANRDVLLTKENQLKANLETLRAEMQQKGPDIIAKDAQRIAERVNELRTGMASIDINTPEGLARFEASRKEMARYAQNECAKNRAACDTIQRGTGQSLFASDEMIQKHTVQRTESTVPNSPFSGEFNTGGADTYVTIDKKVNLPSIDTKKLSAETVKKNFSTAEKSITSEIKSVGQERAEIAQQAAKIAKIQEQRADNGMDLVTMTETAGFSDTALYKPQMAGLAAGDPESMGRTMAAYDRNGRSINGQSGAQVAAEAVKQHYFNQDAKEATLTVAGIVAAPLAAPVGIASAAGATAVRASAAQAMKTGAKELAKQAGVASGDLGSAFAGTYAAGNAQTSLYNTAYYGEANQNLLSRDTSITSAQNIGAVAFTTMGAAPDVMKGVKMARGAGTAAGAGSFTNTGASKLSSAPRAESDLAIKKQMALVNERRPLNTGNPEEYAKQVAARAQLAEAYKHETSSYLHGVKNQKELHQRTAEYVEKLEAAESAAQASKVSSDIQVKAGKVAQVDSAKHQADIHVMASKTMDGNETPTAAAIKAGRGNRGALTRGMADSDKGKLAQYQELLTAESGPAKAKSEMLLDFLRGKGPQDEANILRKILDKEGVSKEASLLNPKLTNGEIREVFRNSPALKNYLHEFPGMSDAIMAYRSGIISASDLEKQLAANLFHNGPNEGFWKFFGEKVIPDFALAGKGKNAENFFENTVFASVKNEKGVMVPRYGTPTSYEGAAHLIPDRVSQGSRGGVEKIFQELRSGTPPEKFNPVETLRMMVQDNPGGTVAQLKKFSSDIETIKNLTPKQAAVLRSMNSAAEQRISQLRDYMKENIHFVKNGKDPAAEVILKMPNGGTKIFKATDDPDSILNAALDVMKHEEKLHGDPITDLLKPKSGDGFKGLARAEQKAKVDKEVAELRALSKDERIPQASKASAEIKNIAKQQGLPEELVRQNRAAEMLNRNLSPIERDAITDAHNIGQGKMIGEYSSKEIAEKDRKLANAGFSKPERELLIRKGITGEVAAHPAHAKGLDEFVSEARNLHQKDGRFAFDSTVPLKAGNLTLASKGGERYVVKGLDSDPKLVLDEIRNARAMQELGIGPETHLLPRKSGGYSIIMKEAQGVNLTDILVPSKRTEGTKLAIEKTLGIQTKSVDEAVQLFSAEINKNPAIQEKIKQIGKTLGENGYDTENLHLVIHPGKSSVQVIDAGSFTKSAAATARPTEHVTAMLQSLKRLDQQPSRSLASVGEDTIYDARRFNMAVQDNPNYKKLGEGDNGLVYLHKPNGNEQEQYVLKVYKDGINKPEKAVANDVAGFKYMDNLFKENNLPINTIKILGQDRTKLRLAYTKGETLESLLNNPSLSTNDKQRLTRVYNDALSAVDKAYAEELKKGNVLKFDKDKKINGFSQRSIVLKTPSGPMTIILKPDNILVDQATGKITLIDPY